MNIVYQLPIIILWGLNMLTLQWQSNQGVPKQMQIQSQLWYHVADSNHPFSINDFKIRFRIRVCEDHGFII